MVTLVKLTGHRIRMIIHRLATPLASIPPLEDYAPLASITSLHLAADSRVTQRHD